MQDVFVEYMVAQRKTPKTTLLKALIVVAFIVLAPSFLMFSHLLGPLSFLGALFFVGGGYCAYFFIISMNLEFEYTITNGEMDVDKIIAQRRRKRLMSIKLREVEAFGRYVPDEHANKNYESMIFACDCPFNPELWYCQKGRMLLVFNANDKMLDAIKKFLPGPILREAFK